MNVQNGNQNDPIVADEVNVQNAKKKRKQKESQDPYAIRYKTKKRKIVQCECQGRRKCRGSNKRQDKRDMNYFCNKYGMDTYCSGCDGPASIYTIRTRSRRVNTGQALV